MGLVDDLLLALRTRKATQSDASAALMAAVLKGQASVIRPVAPYCSQKTLAKAFVAAATHCSVRCQRVCCALFSLRAAPHHAATQSACVGQFIEHCLEHIPDSSKEEGLAGAAGCLDETAASETLPLLVPHVRPKAVDRAFCAAVSKVRSRLRH